MASTQIDTRYNITVKQSMLFHLPLRNSFLIVSYLVNHKKSCRLFGSRRTSSGILKNPLIHTTSSTNMATQTNSDNTVEPTQGDKLKEFYGSETATMYAGMMEEEMVKYTDDFDLVFQTLQESFLPNNNNDTDTIIKVLDTCCGSGHMLKYIGEKLPDKCELKGIDLSPDMLASAQSIVPGTQKACLEVGNMLDMSSESDQSYHLILNNFAMHHATALQAEAAIQEYARLLLPKGCFYFSAWEGTGKIDYGDMDMDMDASYHPEADMKRWITETAGLTILNYRSFVEKEMGDMNSVYFVAQKL